MYFNPLNFDLVNSREISLKVDHVLKFIRLAAKKVST